MPDSKPPARDDLTEAGRVLDPPAADPAKFARDLARHEPALGRIQAAERRIALVLTNDPQGEGRIGSGVGLDTPQAAIAILHALKDEGYRVENIPADGTALTRCLLDGPAGTAPETFARSDYEMFLSSLSRTTQERIAAHWGAIENDPSFRPSRLDCGAFAIPAIRCGNVVIGAPPAHHTPDAPSHGYAAFYAWLTDGVRMQAIIHLGEPGDLAWLPDTAREAVR